MVIPTRRSLRDAGLLVALTGFGIGCDSLLEVENPGSITDEEIRTPESAEAWANGALRLTQRGLDRMVALLSTA